MTGDEAAQPSSTQVPEDDADQLFRALRHSPLPLSEKLARIAAMLEASEPQYAKAYDQLVARLQLAHAGEAAPSIGTEMPGFMLPDDRGRLVSLDRMLMDGPVIIAFLRGHWCPFCRLTAIALAEIEQDIAPTRIVAISPETAAFGAKLREDSNAQFAILTDMGNGYAMSLGLSFALGEELEALFTADACPIPAYQGSDGWFLPIPAIFVVGRDGIIKDRYVNADFRQRMDMESLRNIALTASAGHS